MSLLFPLSSLYNNDGGYMNNDKIKESFQELLKQKKYTSISIQNITDHAQIS